MHGRERLRHYCHCCPVVLSVYTRSRSYARNARKLPDTLALSLSLSLDLSSCVPRMTAERRGTVFPHLLAPITPDIFSATVGELHMHALSALSGSNWQSVLSHAKNVRRRYVHRRVEKLRLPVSALKLRCLLQLKSFRKACRFQNQIQKITNPH